MSARWMPVSLLDRLNDLCPYRIEMYVSYKNKKIIVFVARYGFIAIFKQVPATVMHSIVIESIPGEKLLHGLILTGAAIVFLITVKVSLMHLLQNK